MINRIIDKHNEDISQSLIHSIRVIAQNENNKYFWIIRRYYPGSSLAKFDKSESFWGYDKIRPKYMLRRKQIIAQVVEAISALQGLTNDFRKLNIKKDEFPKRHFVNLSDNKPESIEKRLNLDLTPHQFFYNKIRSDYLLKENSLACVADLSPANIIIREDNRLFFTDFEMFCFDNYTLDVAYLWLFLYQYPNWQSSLINALIRNDQDRGYFRASIIRILFQQIYWPAISSRVKDPREQDAYTKKHKWFKYLMSAGESFEALMKVK